MKTLSRISCSLVLLYVKSQIVIKGEKNNNYLVVMYVYNITLRNTGRRTQYLLFESRWHLV